MSRDLLLLIELEEQILNSNRVVDSFEVYNWVSLHGGGISFRKLAHQIAQIANEQVVERNQLNLKKGETK